MAKNLPKTGIEFIAKGKDVFLRGLQDAKKAVKTFGDESKRSSEKTSSVFGDVMKGTVAANAAIGVFTNLTNQLTSVTNQAFSAATSMQTLVISLESLAAKEIVAAGGASDITDAMKKAQPVAAGLLDRIREISLESPFEYQDIVNVFRLNMAFGQTSDMALELTRAILNMSAASGQGSMMMSRIAYNFSQMSLTGRVTQRDIRDLAMAGVDVAAVFRDELEMSIKEVDAALKSGNMTFKEVSEAFVRYADKNYGGAAERMSKTFEGLKSSFVDLVTFAGLDVFGPSLDLVTTKLELFFGTAQMFVDSGALQDLGTILGEVTNLFITQTPVAADVVGSSMSSIQRSLEETSPAAANALEEIGGENQMREMRLRFQRIAEDAVQWGANIVTNLAQGIIIGAAAVISALLYIGKIIAGWLAPGSPPKILPDLPDWGASAMMEYLKGFTEADFSILGGVSGPLEQALALMGKESLIPEMQLAMTRALSRGKLDDALIKTIMDTTGVFGPEIIKLTKLELSLDEANKKLLLSQNALTRSYENETSAYNKVNTELKRYNSLLRGRASKAILKTQRKRFDQASDEYKQARLGRSEAEKNLDAAKQGIVLLKEQISLQKQLVSQLINYAQAQLRAAQAQEDARSATEDEVTEDPGAGGGTPQVPLPEITMPEVGGAGDPFQEIGDAFKERIKAIFEQMKADIVQTWENTGIQAKWEELLGLINIEKLLPEGTLEVVARAAGIFLSLAAAFWVVNGALKIFSPLITFVASPVGLLTVALGALLAALYLGQDGLMAFSGGSKILGKSIKKFTNDAINGFTDMVVEIIDLTKRLSEDVDIKFSEIEDYILTFFINSMSDLLDWIGEIDLAFTTAIGDFEEFIGGVLSTIGGFVPEFESIGRNMTEGLIDGVLSGVQGLVDAVVDAITAAINAAYATLNSHSPSRVFADIGRTMPQGMRKGIMEETKTVSAPAKPAYIQNQHAINNSVNVDMGGVSIYDQMSAVQFEASVRDIFSRALGVS